jgi:hypothetical protein
MQPRPGLLPIVLPDDVPKKMAPVSPALGPFLVLAGETLMGMLVLCTGIGLWRLDRRHMARPRYGLVGAIIGAPAGFIINVTRRFPRWVAGRLARPCGPPSQAWLARR